MIQILQVGKVKPANIIDIAPTVLQLLEGPVVSDLKGKVIS